MKYVRVLLVFVLAASCALVPRPVPGQTGASQPVAVVSVSGINGVLGSLRYLASAAGSPEAAGLLEIASSQFVQGLDKNRPAGVLITIAEMEPKGVIFLPVTDVQQALALVEQRFGKVEQGTNGIKKLPFSQPVFVREKDGWVFVSDSDKNLSSVPDDPSRLLGDLPSKYMLALRLFVRNIPQDLRQMAMDQVRAGMEANLPAQGSTPEEQFVRQMSHSYMEALTQFSEESDQLTLGLAIDGASKRTFVDVSFLAKPGSRLAQQFNQQSRVVSSFAGFLLPEAAMAFQATGTMPQAEREQLTQVMKMLRQRADEGIARNHDLPNDEVRNQAREVVHGLLDAFQKTVDEGRIDMAGACLLEPGSLKFAAGAAVADGPAFEKAVKQLYELVHATAPESRMPHADFDAFHYGNVTVHSLRVPIPEGDRDARKLFGPQLEVYLGMGPKAVYLAFGTASNELLKRVIEMPTSQAQRAVVPAQLSLALGPIVKFVAARREDAELKKLAASMDQAAGKDHVLIQVTSVENGQTLRLEVEEGVLSIIGQAARARKGLGHGF